MSANVIVFSNYFSYSRLVNPDVYHAFMFSLVSHFFPISIQYLQCIHCLLHQTLEQNQLLTIYQGVHITYSSNTRSM